MQQVKETTHEDLLKEYEEKRLKAIAREQEEDLRQIQEMKQNGISYLNGGSSGNTNSWNLYNNDTDSPISSNPDDYIIGKEFLCNNEDEYLKSDDVYSAEAIEELLIMAMNTTSSEKEKEQIAKLLEIGRNSNFIDFETKSYQKWIITAAPYDDPDRQLWEAANDFAYNFKTIRDAEKNMSSVVPDNVVSNTAEEILASTLGRTWAGILFIGSIAIDFVNEVKEFDEATSEGSPKPGVYYEFRILYEDVDIFYTSDEEESFLFMTSVEVEALVGPDDEILNALNEVDVNWLEINPFG